MAAFLPKQRVFLFALLAFVGYPGVLGGGYPDILRSTDGFDYGVIIDAGSSGSRVHVYKFAPRASFDSTSPWTPPSTEVGWSDMVKPGISSYTSNTTALIASIDHLVQFAKKIVPEESQKSTPIYLGSTAGMRILDLKFQTQIMEALRDFFASDKCPFLFTSRTQARILSGEEEGVFGWLSVNYLMGTLSDGQTYGALDLGGASTQITFRPRPQEPILSNFYPLHLHNLSRGVYTHSFLNYGQNEAFDRLDHIAVSGKPVGASFVEFGCYAKGYNKTTPEGVVIVGSSNYSECVKSTQSLFLKGNCFTESCSFNSVYQPPLYGKFVGFSGFDSYIKDVNLSSHATYEEIASKAKVICDSTYSQINSSYPEERKYSMDFCIGLTLVQSILGYGYGFDNSTQATITFENKINGSSVSWSQGMMLYEVHYLKWQILNSNGGNSDGDRVSKHYQTATYAFAALFAVTLATLGVVSVLYARLKQRVGRGENEQHAERLFEPIVGDEDI
mmetsp:Transcript_12106/g.22080  ORF Transcript_12106/g.22080 Transcript_12106/m.22080 type:complete len:503 (-) Transcript_12106:68-1576(-)